MTDEILINNFLTRHYDVIINNGEFCFRDKSSKQTLKIGELSIVFSKIFSYDKTDDLKKPMEIAKLWLESKRIELTKIINGYLADYKVILNKSDWEVRDKENNLVTNETIMKLATNGSIGMFYVSIFEEWLDNEILIVSLKLMDEYD